MVTTYDSACYELAEHFLQDEPFGNPNAPSYEEACHALALTIQQAVEDWFPVPLKKDAKEAKEYDSMLATGVIPPSLQHRFR